MTDLTGVSLGYEQECTNDKFYTAMVRPGIVACIYYSDLTKSLSVQLCPLSISGGDYVPFGHPLYGSYVQYILAVARDNKVDRWPHWDIEDNDFLMVKCHIENYFNQKDNT